MKRPHFSIARLMIIVGVVAYNLAAAQQLVGGVGGLFLIGLALQAGLVCLVRNRPGSRSFWVGFLATGLAAMMVPIAIAVFGEEDSESLRLLEWYLISAMYLVERACLLIRDPRSQAEWTLYLVQDAQVYILEVAIFLLQLVVAVAGGLISGFVGKRLSRSSLDSTRGGPSTKIVTAVSDEIT